ncbi:substrate-binding domain-containing protein [Verrucomicrobium spinosum]|uniref:substrate-binding domain-containing protein n=1 Tax=Verrucomicrobium spinosum TaxID=2736 RepID=UPI0009461C51|nr:substrate-binding domain-containing protein [Verrucomicrobium spinosum]
MQLTLGALLLGSAGCHQAAPDKVLVVYAAGPRELAESMCKDFEKQSGVTTRLFSATTGEIMAKLKAEEFQPQADVVILAGQTAAQVLKEEGSLARLPKGDYLKLNPQWNDPELLRRHRCLCLGLGRAQKSRPQCVGLAGSL